MKKLQLFYLILFSFTSFNIYSQILTETEMKSEKNKPQKRSDYDFSDSSKTDLLFTFFTAYNGRNLISNDYPFGKDIGERVNETSIWTTNYAIGFRQKLNKNFSFEGKLSFIKTGEQYHFKSNMDDSTYNYTQNYTYIGMPLTINYISGKKLKFLFGIGLTPQIFANSSKKTTWTTSENQSDSEILKTKQSFNYFNLGTTIQTGFNYQFNEKWSFEILPTFRNQLFSSYLKTSNFKHYNYQFGVQYGLNFKL